MRTVLGTDDLADVARLLVDGRLRSVPVLEDERLAGIVSRRDLLRTIGRSDDEIRHDPLALVEDYTGESGAWDVSVTEGTATIRRGWPAPGVGRHRAQCAAGAGPHRRRRDAVRILTETDV